MEELMSFEEVMNHGEIMNNIEDMVIFDNDMFLIEEEEKKFDNDIYKMFFIEEEKNILKSSFVDEKTKLKRKIESEKKRKTKNLKRSREMGVDLLCYEKLDIKIRDRRKKARKSNVTPVIPGKNFSYSVGISKILNSLFLNSNEIVSIGKKRGYWDNKLQKSVDGKCQITASVNLTLRKMAINNEIKISIYNGVKYYHN